MKSSPQAISSGMLRIPPNNLNSQSQQATILLIREVLQKGLQLTEVKFLHISAIPWSNISQVYVDALGNTATYEAYLSSQFPGINFTVKNKADSIFKIVGAASVAAKVTRDACLEGWVYEEPNFTNSFGHVGSGYPSGETPSAWTSMNTQ